MKGFFKKIPPLLLVVIVAICFFQQKGFFSNDKSEIIISDGHGYYCYLPATFIYHDYSFSFLKDVQKKYYQFNSMPDFVIDADGKKVDKYFSGTALLLLPFFFLAHLLSLLLGFPADGYSLLYQYLVGVGALFYLFAGLRFVYKMIFSITNDVFVSALFITALALGTSLYHYTIDEPSMSHVFSFAAVSGFLFYTSKYIISGSYRDFIYLSIALGLIALIRPLNGMILIFIPFFFTDFKDLFAFIKQQFIFEKIVLFAGILFCIISIQPILWFLQTGHFVVDSYKYEGFNFSKPHMYNVLFSYKKGLFVYTPLLLLIFPALVFMFIKNKFKTISFVLFFTSVTYVVSSWWNWHYGMSFGMRVYIDFFCPIIVFTATGFAGKGNIMRAALLLFSVICIYVNIIQNYQYRNYILHWECMTKAKYKKIFLKTGDEYKGVLWDDNTTDNYEYYDKGVKLRETECDFENTAKPGWKWNGAMEADPTSVAKNNLVFVDSAHEYSGGLEMKINFITQMKHLVIKTYCRTYLSSPDSKAELVLSVENAKGVNYWSSKKIPNFMDDKINEWVNIRHHDMVQNVEPGDFVKAYLWNKGKSKTLMDNLKVEFYEFNIK